jgi:hypothetical protein
MDMRVSGPPPSPAAWPPSPPPASLRIASAYLARHGRRPDLANPRRFSELVQLRKLTDRDPRLPPLADAVGVKAMVSDLLGRKWCVPTAWQGAQVPQRRAWPGPSVVKARHGGRRHVVLRSRPSSAAWSMLRARGRAWTARRYGGLLGEWLYREVPRGVLCEPLLCGGGCLPTVYGIYVFAGAATHVEVRRNGQPGLLHDREWRQLVRTVAAPPPPRSLEVMLEAAEILAGGLSFVRVDFHEDFDGPLFAGFAAYPDSGLSRFAADWVDLELGGLWRLALGLDRWPYSLAPEPVAAQTSFTCSRM